MDNAEGEEEEEVSHPGLAQHGHKHRHGHTFKFDVGTRVSYPKHGVGTVTELMWRNDEDMEPGMGAPYQIKLDNGDIISAPADSEDLVRRAPPEVENDNRNKRQRA